jgi:hypothetical protein
MEGAALLVRMAECTHDRSSLGPKLESIEIGPSLAEQIQGGHESPL